MRKKRTTMEGSERSHPHRSGSSAGGASDFFVCFTARPSSSSASSASAAMRIPSSKALMSPGRGRDPSSAPALSVSLSRRLRSSGSVKGGQSPMFPSGVQFAGRKKGCTFEAAEPSSPKVTCIGQVRVKAKKKVKSKAKAAMARSRSQRGRECCPGRNQSWVHQLPVSICEALKGVGSEFSCFLPCGGRSLCGSGSSYSSSKREGEKGREERRIGRSASSSSCGAVLAKWVVAVQESEEEVMRGEKVEVGFLLRERDEKVAEVEIEELRNMGGEKRERLTVGEKGEGGEEEAARVSVCIPPRNALLLMRCRSDPVRMAALANRFWGSPANNVQCEEEQLTKEDSEVAEEMHKQGTQNVEEEQADPWLMKIEGDPVEISVATGEQVNVKNVCEKTTEEGNILIEEKSELLEEEMGSAREELSCRTPPTLQLDPPKTEAKGETLGLEEHKKSEVSNRTYYLPEKGGEKAEEKIKGSRVREERKSSNICASMPKERGRRRSKKDNRRHSFSSEVDTRRHSFSSDREARRASFSIDRGCRWSFSFEKTELEPNGVIPLPFSTAEVCPDEENQKKVTQEEEGAKSLGYTESEKLVNGLGKHEPEGEAEEKGVAGECTELPDCLLMMMYEPKLSMEVSKETWVCGNDFLRWRPPNTRSYIPSKPFLAVQSAGDNVAAPPPESVSTVTSAVEANVPVTVTIPQPEPPIVTAIQHKQPVRPAAVAPYEPLVLTRCKSEPVRASARLTPDACFWKDRHRPIGAAGIGF